MKWLVNILLVFLSISAFATHNRAGEITYKQISELTYEIKLVTYTYTPSAANETRDKLPISWGDNTESLIPRQEILILPDNYSKNTYIARHTYPGPGVYKIVMEDPNRNDGVNNIPGSVNVIFSVASTLKIDATLGFNTTPVLLNPPLDKALTGQVFIHNPGAFDAEGDSISYKLTSCRQENGDPIPGYTYPLASHSFSVNAITGDLIWDAPTQTGTYNIAMLIEEWRKKIKIGQIIRDIQVEVLKGDDIKPEITPLPSYCIEAGGNLNFLIEATDVDNDKLIFSYSGGPFEVDPYASCQTLSTIPGYLKAKFDWDTDCSLIRKNPYQAVFKVKEQHKDPALVDYKSTMITIISPAPENLLLNSTFNSISISWDAVICTDAIAYDIYRKESPSGWTASSCEFGIPDYVGFQKIGRTKGYNSINFTDNNNNEGLNQGYQYCYRIVAIFPDGAESYASDEVCTELEMGYPLITKVSIDSTDETKGRINLHWSKYLNFDTGISPGPYVYLIYRSDDMVGENLVLIDSTLSINDTTYLDINLNTEDNIYSYSIAFYNNTIGDRHLIGDPQLASSPFLEISALDNSLLLNVKKNTPWVNDTMIVYRMNPTSVTFDSIGFSTSNRYTDQNLINDIEYCYYTKLIGHYSANVLPYATENLSQVLCSKPTDTVAPCSPSIQVKSICDEFYNQIKWKVHDTCKQDIVSYNLYYSSTIDADLEIIYSSNNKNDTLFLHYPDESIAGCYAITAVDSFANESAFSNKICIDECTYYELPNVFTPNGDNKNDLIIPSPYKFIQKVDMKIYNRWGVLVFQTEDPDINWDGRFMGNGKILSPGVYYYVCDVYEYRLSGVELRVLTGFIHLFDPKGNGSE